MRPLALVALAVLLVGFPATAADTDLTIDRISITMKGTVCIKARFDPNAVPAIWYQSEDPCEVRLGDLPLVELDWYGVASIGRGLTIRHRRKGEEYRRMTLDLAGGVLTLKAKNVDLSAIGDPMNPVVVLVLGETELTGTVTSHLKKRSTVYKGPRAPRVGEPLQFRTAGRDVNGMAHVGSVHVARTEEELEAIWPSLWGDAGGSVYFPPPEIDFENEMAVLVNLGMRGSRAVRVKVRDVRERGDGVHVICRELLPGAAGGGGGTPAVAGNPWALIACEPRPGIVTAEIRVVKP